MPHTWRRADARLSNRIRSFTAFLLPVLLAANQAAAATEPSAVGLDTADSARVTQDHMIAGYGGESWLAVRSAHDSIADQATGAAPDLRGGADLGGSALEAGMPAPAGVVGRRGTFGGTAAAEKPLFEDGALLPMTALLALMAVLLRSRRQVPSAVQNGEPPDGERATASLSPGPAREQRLVVSGEDDLTSRRRRNRARQAPIYVRAMEHGDPRENREAS